MTDSLSAGDLLALTKNDDGWTNNPFIYLVWLALLGGGFNGFGYGNNAAGYLTGAEVANAIVQSNADQDVFRNFGQIATELSSFERDATANWNNIRYDNMVGINQIQHQMAENRYAQQNCCCETNRNIDSVKAEAYQNTCAITTAIRDEGAATRALIEANTVQALRDKLADKDRELMTANFLISQSNQNAYLVDSLKPTPIPAYVVSSPYATNNGLY